MLNTRVCKILNLFRVTNSKLKNVNSNLKLVTQSWEIKFSIRVINSESKNREFHFESLKKYKVPLPVTNSRLKNKTLHFRLLTASWKISDFNFSEFLIREIKKKLDFELCSSIRWTVWQGTDCFALWSNYLRKSLYKSHISIKPTLFFTNGVRFIEIPL